MESPRQVMHVVNINTPTTGRPLSSGGDVSGAVLAKGQQPGHGTASFYVAGRTRAVEPRHARRRLSRRHEFAGCRLGTSASEPGDLALNERGFSIDPRRVRSPGMACVEADARSPQATPPLFTHVLFQPARYHTASALGTPAY